MSRGSDPGFSSRVSLQPIIRPTLPSLPTTTITPQMAPTLPMDSMADKPMTRALPLRISQTAVPPLSRRPLRLIPHPIHYWKEWPVLGDLWAKRRTRRIRLGINRFWFFKKTFVSTLLFVNSLFSFEENLFPIKMIHVLSHS